MGVILRRMVDKIDEDNKSQKEIDIDNKLSRFLVKLFNDNGYSCVPGTVKGLMQIDKDIAQSNSLNINYKTDVVFNTNHPDISKIIIEEISPYHFDIFNNFHKTTSSIKNANHENTNKFIFKLYDIITLFLDRVNKDYNKYKFYKQLAEKDKTVHIYFAIPEYFDTNNYTDKDIKSNTYTDICNKVIEMYKSGKRLDNFIVFNDKMASKYIINDIKMKIKNKENTNNDKQ